MVNSNRQKVASQNRTLNLLFKVKSWQVFSSEKIDTPAISGELSGS